MEIILLEKHAKLGNLGDVVNVKNGYARNFLIPQNKALRATKENKVSFESQKAEVQKEMDQKISEANVQKGKIENQHISIIMQASDDGKLYGSVNSGAVVSLMKSKFGLDLNKNNVTFHEQIKFIGDYGVKISFCADIATNLRVIVARSEEEVEVILSGKKQDDTESTPSEESHGQLNQIESEDELSEDSVDTE